MPIFYANKDYSRSWTRCLYARFPNAVIQKVEKGYPDGWIKVWYKNSKRFWKGRIIEPKNVRKGDKIILNDFFNKGGVMTTEKDGREVEITSIEEFARIGYIDHPVRFLLGNKNGKLLIDTRDRGVIKVEL